MLFPSLRHDVLDFQSVEVERENGLRLDVLALVLFFDGAQDHQHAIAAEVAVELPANPFGPELVIGRPTVCALGRSRQCGNDRRRCGLVSGQGGNSFQQVKREGAVTARLHPADHPAQKIAFHRNREEIAVAIIRARTPHHFQ